jgi:hypothetical protein
MQAGGIFGLLTRSRTRLRLRELEHLRRGSQIHRNKANYSVSAVTLSTYAARAASSPLVRSTCSDLQFYSVSFSSRTRAGAKRTHRISCLQGVQLIVQKTFVRTSNPATMRPSSHQTNPFQPIPVGRIPFTPLRSAQHRFWRRQRCTGFSCRCCSWERSR